MSAPRLVVVGASLAGLRAVITARELGFRGPLTLVGAEAHLPYDRPPLSKAFIDGVQVLETPHLPGSDTLAGDLGVDLRLGTPASALDTASKTLRVGDEELPYDALVIATGASARRLPGTEHLRGVHVLRALDDALAIRDALDVGARTVVIGAGFIGAEVAASARKRGLPVTVLEMAPTPLVRAVGATAGGALGRLHARYGTDLRCGVTVAGLEGDSRVTGVRLADGTVLDADLVVVGIGATPCTEWLEGSGLTLDDGVVCDPRLWTGVDGVWAAGDVARWLSPDFGTLLRLEHWTNAGDQGAHAVRGALDPSSATPYSHVPYFWSDWYEHRIQFVGLPTGEPELLGGSWDGDAFVAAYREGDRLMGVLALNRRGDVMKYRGLIGRRASWDETLAFAATRKPIAV